MQEGHGTGKVFSPGKSESCLNSAQGEEECSERKRRAAGQGGRSQRPCSRAFVSPARSRPSPPTADMSAHTPARTAGGPANTPAHTPGQDSAQLVDRLQALKQRLSTMTRTLEDSVATASPLRGKANEEILYSTPKLVKELVDGVLGQDPSLFLAPGEAAPAGTQVTEVRFTLAASSEEEIETLVKLLEVQGAHGNGKA